MNGWMILLFRATGGVAAGGTVCGAASLAPLVSLTFLMALSVGGVVTVVPLLDGTAVLEEC